MDYPIREMPCWDCGEGVMSACRNPERVLCPKCLRNRKRDANREKWELRRERRVRTPLKNHSQQDLGAIYALVVDNPGITYGDLARRVGLTLMGLEVALASMAKEGFLLYESDTGDHLYPYEVDA